MGIALNQQNIAYVNTGPDYRVNQIVELLRLLITAVCCNTYRLVIYYYMLETWRGANSKIDFSLALQQNMCWLAVIVLSLNRGCVISNVI